MKGQDVTVAELQFSGTKRTKVTFIENLVNIKKGMVLDSVLMNRDMLRLKRLPSISHAYYKVNVLQNETCKVEYIIEENFTLIPFANLFSSSNDNFAFRVGLQEFNSFGRNITLGAFYQYDNYSSFGVSVRAPYLFSNKLGVAVNYNDFTTLEPVFRSELSISIP